MQEDKFVEWLESDRNPIGEKGEALAPTGDWIKSILYPRQHLGISENYEDEITLDFLEDILRTGGAFQVYTIDDNGIQKIVVRINYSYYEGKTLRGALELAEIDHGK